MSDTEPVVATGEAVSADRVCLLAESASTKESVELSLRRVETTTTEDLVGRRAGMNHEANHSNS